MSSTEAKIETEAVEAVEVKSTEEPAKTDDQVSPQCLLQTLQTFSISNPINTRFWFYLPNSRVCAIDNSQLR